MRFDSLLKGAQTCVIWVNRQAVTMVTTTNSVLQLTSTASDSVATLGLRSGSDINVWAEQHSSVCVSV